METPELKRSEINTIGGEQGIANTRLVLFVT